MVELFFLGGDGLWRRDRAFHLVVRDNLFLTLRGLNNEGKTDGSDCR
jgi:hypothetical protein